MIESRNIPTVMHCDGEIPKLEINLLTSTNESTRIQGSNLVISKVRTARASDPVYCTARTPVPRVFDAGCWYDLRRNQQRMQKRFYGTTNKRQVLLILKHTV